MVMLLCIMSMVSFFIIFFSEVIVIRCFKPVMVESLLHPHQSRPLDPFAVVLVKNLFSSFFATLPQVLGMYLLLLVISIL